MIILRFQWNEILILICLLSLLWNVILNKEKFTNIKTEIQIVTSLKMRLLLLKKACDKHNSFKQWKIIHSNFSFFLKSLLSIWHANCRSIFSEKRNFFSFHFYFSALLNNQLHKNTVWFGTMKRLRWEFQYILTQFDLWGDFCWLIVVRAFRNFH